MRALTPIRYLVLLDKHLDGMAPKDIKAATMPTLEELQAEMDNQGAQWVRDALATDPGEYEVSLFDNYTGNHHALDKLKHKIQKPLPCLKPPVHLQVQMRF